MSKEELYKEFLKATNVDPKNVKKYSEVRKLECKGSTIGEFEGLVVKFDSGVCLWIQDEDFSWVGGEE